METLTPHSVNFNEVQNLLVALAKGNGVSMEVLLEDEDWQVNYRRSLQEKFEKSFGYFLEAIRLARDAYAEGDVVSARCGLVEAIVRAGILQDFFGAIDADLIKILREVDWPEIPEGYEIPERYKYQEPK